MTGYRRISGQLHGYISCSGIGPMSPRILMSRVGAAALPPEHEAAEYFEGHSRS